MQIIKVKDKTGRTGTVIGQQHNVWFVHWEGKKYETEEFGSIDKDQVEELTQDEIQ